MTCTIQAAWGEKKKKKKIDLVLYSTQPQPGLQSPEAVPNPPDCQGLALASLAQIQPSEEEIFETEISAPQVSVVPRYLKATLRSLWEKEEAPVFVGWSDAQLCPRLPAKPKLSLFQPHCPAEKHGQ